jgi:hypothetical protein
MRGLSRSQWRTPNFGLIEFRTDLSPHGALLIPVLFSSWCTLPGSGSMQPAGLGTRGVNLHSKSVWRLTSRPDFTRWIAWSSD